MGHQKGLQPGTREAPRVPPMESLSGNGSLTSRMSDVGTHSVEATSDPMRRPFEIWATPLMLLLLSLLSYGLLIPWLGFYWDDWPAMWVLHSLGGDGLKEYMATDRPFLGWLYAMTGPVLGDEPLSWHVFALLVRWMSGVALWWCLRGLWPERRREIAAVACLFTVYPGFTLQPIAWCHSHVFIMLGLVMLSLGAMVWAERLDRWRRPLTIVAVSSSAVTMMVSEYFVGLELLRPVLLWTVLSTASQKLSRRLARILRSWLPFLAILTMYLVWRLALFHPSGVNDQSQVFRVIQTNPLGYLLHRVYGIVTDLIEAGLVAWARTAAADLLTFDSIRWVSCGMALVLTAAAATFWYLKQLGPASDANASVVNDASPNWVKQAIGIGLVALLAGGLPFWFGNRDIRLDTLADRYTLPVMLGSILVLVAVTHTITKKPVQQMAVIGLLAGLAVGFHFRNAVQFLHDWSDQKSLYWQLSWRAPGLEPGTMVLADEAVVSFPRSYSLLGPINFLYAPHHASSRLDYGFFALPTVLGDELPSLVEGQRFSYAFRTLSFTASTSESLVLWFSPPSCLRILDRSRDEIPHLPPLARAAKSMSHLERIIPHASNAAGPPAGVFGREPDHAWCYYFQKADLARQMMDWREVARMGDETERLGLAPSDSTEWFPFLEGYLHTGRPDDAKKLLARIVDDIPAIRSVFTVYDPNRVNRRPVPQIVPAPSPALCRALERFESLSRMSARAGCVLS